MIETHPILLADPFLPHAALASIRFDAMAAADDAATELHHDEQTLALSFGQVRRATFIAGRRALRAALRHVASRAGSPAATPHDVVDSVADAPLLHSVRGAPSLPAGYAGSISHKRSRAIAIATATTSGYVGVDLEARPSAVDGQRPSIADRILTAPERESLGTLDALAHREATLVRFALKEAVYKAIDPYVQRYVQFTEVELSLDNDGRAAVRLLLPEPHMQSVHVTAQWRFDGEWIIAVARSTPVSETR